MHAALLLTWLGLLAAISARPASAAVDYTSFLPPGSPAEAASLLGGSGSRIEGEARTADRAGWWTYRLVAPPATRCILSFEAQGSPAVSVYGADGKPLPSRAERSGSRLLVYATTTSAHPVGAALRFQIRAVSGPIEVRDVRLTLRMPDSSGSGIGDAVERLMGAGPGQRVQSLRPPDRPHTTFQTGDAYRPSIAVPTDSVLVYSRDARTIHSWTDRGALVQTMGGFRDGPAYAKAHPGEVQTEKSGAPITIGDDSYYMVPTVARVDLAKQYYRDALAAGSMGVCPEEPEFWSRAGWSEAFKQEWHARYGSPWQPPDSSVDARYRSEQLKSDLETRQIQAILEDARQTKPSATRMVAVHSPVTYYQWGIPVAHTDLLNLPPLQEMVGQVWTGTARSPARSGGVRSERTFEVGYLEYSSLYNISRGSGKRMWFLMDPVEDNPNRTLQDYKSNYEQTLLASLLFPGVDSFEVMPWPSRIYDRVPREYATEVNTIIGVLGELWRYGKSDFEGGSAGIATLISDSMDWQRAEPDPSDFDGFYGMSLPLVLHGVPVDLVDLDRAGEYGYLDREKVLLLSYDFLKPRAPEANRAVAAWVRQGGMLVVFGGTNAYDAVTNSWWRRERRASPVDDLFAQLGLSVRSPQVLPAEPDTAPWTTLLTVGPHPPASRDRRYYTLDLTPYVRQNGSVCVRFTDSTPADGYGAAVGSVELRLGGRLAASFRAGSDLETRFLAEERGTGYNGDVRFADRSSYWIYRFDNLPRDRQVTLTVDMGGGYDVAAQAPPPAGPVLNATDPKADPTLAHLRVHRPYVLTLCPPPSGANVLYRESTQNAPVVWEAPAGRGTVLFAGVSPGYLSATVQSSRWLRWLAQRAFEKTGGTYRETAYFRITRGPYTAVRTLGRELTVDGRYVDLLNPELPVVEDPLVPPHAVALLQDVGDLGQTPAILAVSGRLRARHEDARTSSLFVRAPAGTQGVARLWTGGRRLLGAKGYTVSGAPLPVSYQVEGDTVALRYPNQPDGAVVRAVWN